VSRNDKRDGILTQERGERMAKIGYVRVSKHEQNKDLQIDALKEAGCEKIFTDEMSGSKGDRKGLGEILAYVRPGDTFVVWKLDRAGRSLKNLIELLNALKHMEVEFVSLTEKIDTTTAGGKLIFHMTGAFAEFERDLIRERTRAGLAAARARGRNGGRPRAIRNGKATLARRLYDDKSNSIDDICETLGVSRSTLYRYMREENK
jgi:DNA invertase Pin-like site-specific DNA recombinase